MALSQYVAIYFLTKFDKKGLERATKELKGFDKVVATGSFRLRAFAKAGGVAAAAGLAIFTKRSISAALAQERLDKSLQLRLEQLLGRLTEEEITVITQLSQETEALTLAEILNKTQLSHSDLINAIKSLCMRFLLETQEREKITFFTLNSVMMQYVKTRQKH
jgi:hypothetical protein